jgi:hypothetical protein
MRTTAATVLIVACLCLICGQALAEYLPEEPQHDAISAFEEAQAGSGDQPASALHMAHPAGDADAHEAPGAAGAPSTAGALDVVGSTEPVGSSDASERSDKLDEAPGEPADGQDVPTTVDVYGAVSDLPGAPVDRPKEAMIEPHGGEEEPVDGQAGEPGETDAVSAEAGDEMAQADAEAAETESEAAEVDSEGAETVGEGVEARYTGEPASGPQADEGASGVSPVLSRLLTREIDLLAAIPEGIDPTERPDDGDLGAVLDRPAQIDVAEEACYVRVMSHGLASVREVRSLDLYPGRSLLRLQNIPTSVMEESIFLSVWHPETDVLIKSYRLVGSDESAELLVEVSSPDRLLGAHLEVYYLTADLEATLGYSGMYDAQGATLRLSEWLTVTNLCGKDFSGAGFSFHLSDLGFENEIASAVTLQAGEKSRFLCRDRILSPATTIVKAESGPSGDAYEITELIKVEVPSDQDLLIPHSTATIYSMDSSGFSTLVADGAIFKPREYSWFTVETLHKPDIRVQRVQTGDEVTGTGIRDVSYMVNIENRSSEVMIVTIYEWIGGNWFLRSATADTKQVAHTRDPERPDYATFTVEVGANSSQALLYKARISDRPER